jgi:hypothetical protein
MDIGRMTLHKELQRRARTIVKRALAMVEADIRSAQPGMANLPYQADADRR